MKLRTDHIISDDVSSTPASAASGYLDLYEDADAWYTKDENGTVTALNGSSPFSVYGLGATESSDGVDSITSMLVRSGVAIINSDASASIYARPRPDARISFNAHTFNTSTPLRFSGVVPSTTGTMGLAETANGGAASITSVAGGSGGRGYISFAGVQFIRLIRKVDFIVNVVTHSTITPLTYWMFMAYAPAGSSDINSIVNTDNPSSYNIYGFRYSTGTDSGWVGYVANGSGSSTTSSLATVSADTAYRLRARCDGTDIKFSVNDGTESLVSDTSKYPSFTADMNATMSVYTKETATKVVYIKSMYVEMDR